jgi:hypothetical protein
MSTNAIAALETGDIAFIKTSSLAALQTAQVTALTTDQMVALTSSQVGALTSGQLKALSTNQLVAIDTADMGALKTAAIAGLSTSHIASLTTAQIASLSDAQISSLSDAQTAALTSDQIPYLGFSTPIVLDLNNNGISTLGLSAGVQFDINATGTKINTGWVGGGDGLLALDRNGDGVINDASELFGSATTLASGQKAKTGYEAMKELDTNGDGSVDAKDSAFASLRVWVDGNADGVSQADELKSLTDLGITKLNLDAKQNVSFNNGNIVGITSTYETADGSSHAAADVWFKTDAGSDNLSSSVSGLSAALSQFGAAAAATTVNAKLEVPSTSSTAVAALADAISSYDNKLTAVSNSAASEDSLRLKALQGGNHQGILAAK